MRFIAVDLEATCWLEADDPELSAAQAEESEIIEIGAVMLDDALLPVSEFQRFIRPVRHPHLSRFCTELTSITQADVEAAELFSSVYEAFVSWMDGTEGVGLVSWSRYDHNQLVTESEAAGLPMPSWTPIDAKEEFTAWARGHTGRRLRFGLSRALTHLDIPVTGTAHRGIDDARSLVSVFQHIRDPDHRSPNATRALEMLNERHPRPANVGHIRSRWSDAKTWYPRTSRELTRLGLAEDVGQGRGLQLTERGLSLV
ncbi:MAG: inhibitor of KinA sporulation pathway (predicted exonuclease) [Myxococcota bacterium]|jgi:inhibitor of KinA sporulation pathway (predicted exonuclease)